MSDSSHVAHECKAIVDSFFFLKIFAFRILHVKLFWPGAIHSTYSAMSVRGP